MQELIGVKAFTKYGLATNKGELLFYLVSPTNISVLSHTNVEIKIRHKVKGAVKKQPESKKTAIFPKGRNAVFFCGIIEL